MPARIMWHDDYDHELVRTRLAVIRQGPCADWDWVSFVEYPDEEDSWPRFATEIGISSAFGSPGKVVYCRGEPSCSAKAAVAISKWASGKGRCPVGPDVSFILVSPPGGKLAKAIASAANSDVKINSVDRLSKGTAPAWVVRRGASMGTMIVDDAAKLMVEMVGFNPNVLTAEIKRLKYLSSDGRIMPWVVQQHCRATTQIEAFGLEKAILFDDHEKAFSLGLASGDEPFRVMGSMSSLLTKHMLLEESGRDIERIAGKLARIKVRRKDDKVEQMFSIAALRVLAGEMSRGNKSVEWSHRSMLLLTKAQKDVRKNPGEAGRILAELAIGMADQ
jgi:DNA polymerase III delta subunit